MESEEKLEEYVLSQDGIIYRGDVEYPVPLAWYFGQVGEITHVLKFKLVSKFVV